MTEPADDVSVLRYVLTSLQQYLAQFGLIPSRVGAFFDVQVDRDGQHTQFPTPRMMGRVVKQELKEGTDVAVSSFMEMLLDVEAPPQALPSFMQALFTANHSDDRQHPNVNEGCWRVHDVITLACAYRPLQEALLTYLGQDQGQRVDIQGVVTQMNDQRQLKPDYTAHVLETLELDGREQAAVHMLASVYATRVDLLKDDYDDYLAERAAAAGSVRKPSGGNPAPWLGAVVAAVEAHGGLGFRQSIPEAVLSAATWDGVYDQLAYGRRGRIGDTDDAASEAGESVASDITLVDQDKEEPPADLAEGQSAADLLANNLDPESKRRRTAEYIVGVNRGQEILHMTEIIHHEFHRQREIPAAAAVRVDVDESSSVITTSSNSTSTENNSHVWAEAEDSGGGTMRDLTRSLRAIDLSRHGQINLRAYQEELLQLAREGKNVAIFLPTGTGKTFIILKYVQEQLNRPGLHRVVFLAPKVKLAEQQYLRFRQFFPKSTYFRCGKSRSSPAPFSELLDMYQIFVMTPQCLVEAVHGKEVKMTDFSILVLDECHHVGRGKHAYKVLMGLYMDVKCAEGDQLASLPQVIGLTASPGVGQGGTLQAAATHIKELCYNMDVEKICLVRSNMDELKRFINEPNHEIHTCPRRKYDKFRKIVEELMGHIESSMIDCLSAERYLKEEDKERLLRILKAPELHRGHPSYHHWLCNLDNKLVDFTRYRNTYQTLFCFAEMLVIYQRCLILNENCDSQYALDFVQRQVRVLEDQVPTRVHNSTERNLLDRFHKRVPELQRACNDPEDYNPKLVMLEEVLLRIMEKNEDECQCMVFVRTLELTKAIQCWVQEHPNLRHLNPGRMTGNRRTVAEGGMTKQEISDVMEKFNKGEHQLVVCTSAAEEGLDFQACSIVVRYDYVTNMISMIQTRGRARRMDSQYCVLGNLPYGNADKERANMASERLMNQAVDKVLDDMDTNPNAFLEDMRQWQRRDYSDRKHAERILLEKRRCKVTGNTKTYQLLCRKCQCPVCLSTDFRLLEQSSRAVIREDFKDKWKRVERGEVFQYKHNLEKLAKVHCKACSYDWGILCRYMPTGRQMPVLKIESFMLVDLQTQEKLTRKHKWAEAPFHVQDISEEELI